MAARVPDVDHELLLGGRGVSQRLQPRRQLARPASGHDDEVTAKDLVRKLYPRHAHPRRIGHKSLHRGVVDERDVREREQPTPDVPLDVRATREDIRGGSRVAGDLVPGRHEPDLLHRVATHRAAGDELGLEAGQELFDGGQSTRQQGMHVPSLGYRPAALSGRWEGLSLQDRHPVKVVGYCACRQEAGDACADHHGMVGVLSHGSSVRRT